MLECFEFTAKAQVNNRATEVVSLDFAQRQKSRGQAVTQSGKKVAWFLERGHLLADGDQLHTKSGIAIQIEAAAETLSQVSSNNTLLLTRAAYHLGNRHVPLQIQLGVLSFQHDHVLDDMVRGLGLAVTCVEQPFHPESGAYHNQSHSHGGHHADHSHAHHHNHSHDHPHEHSSALPPSLAKPIAYD